MRHTFHIALYLLLAFCGLWALSACNTGIESTRTIKMSRAEQKDTRPGDEELFASRISSQSFNDWKEGKRFLVSDNRAAVMFGIEPLPGMSAPKEMDGRILRYSGCSYRPTPGGDNTATITFRDSIGNYLYNTERTVANMDKFTGLDVPMLIDLDMVAKADSLMRGMKVWTLSSLWYDGNLEIAKGRKYVPVQIMEVVPGNMVFPLLVRFTDATGAKGSMLMNVSAANGLGAESRTFPALFSLTDPKLKYPAISPEIWQLICDSKVVVGMTKEECRLALGNPTEVDAGHNWSSVIDVWGYKDGSYLQFQDGILVNFRY